MIGRGGGLGERLGRHLINRWHLCGRPYVIPMLSRADWPVCASAIQKDPTCRGHSYYGSFLGDRDYEGQSLMRWLRLVFLSIKSRS